MKKLLLLSSFLVRRSLSVGGLLFLFSFSYAQQYGWQDISANVPGDSLWHDLSDVFFVSDNEGWITSSSHQEIYHTTDGGLTFEIQTTQYSCNAIHMLSENEGYAGGTSGRVYRTIDGGENWIAIGSVSSTLVDINFPPESDTGYCCGINGNIWSIDNAGVTKMTSNVNGNLYAISFPNNSEEGWVCGGDVIRHYASNTWNGDQDYPYGFYNALFMVDTLNGWGVGDNGAIIHTSDGHNWATQQTNPDYILTNVFFVNTQEGWVVSSGGGIFHTINGGTIWNIEGDELSSSILTGVHFTSSTNGYVVGNGKTLLKFGEISGIGDGVETLAFEIFPNPTVDKFKTQRRKAKGENATIEIYDLNGGLLLNKQFPAGTEEIEIDVSHLQSGVYCCKVSTEKKSMTRKLIIK